jgi:glycosyltransferase involved in cell wall biosynthesis
MCGLDHVDSGKLDSERRLSVLYLHPAGPYGGASKSLIELFRKLSTLAVDAAVLTPAGTAAQAFAAVGMAVHRVAGLSQFDNTRFGFYRGIRWIILLREICYLPFSLIGLWRLRHESVDLIHVNEITLLPLGILAKKLLRRPMVVQVRSLQRTPGQGARTERVSAWLQRHADAIIAIDQTVAASLDRRLQVQVVHNGIDLGEAPLPMLHRPPRDVSAPVEVGFLGVLIPLKGIFELVDAMRILKLRGVNVHCTVVGENARELSGVRKWVLGKLGFARDVHADLKAFIAQHGLQEHVTLCGFVADVRSVYPELDILCFPSHLDAAGRPVFEAALHGVPSVVAITSPLSDALVHGVTGLAIPRPDATLIADALQRLAEDESYRLTLGRQAKEWALEQFDIAGSARAVLSIYRQVIDGSSRRAAH